MKVVAYTALHYGRDYLAYAIESIIHHVDEYHVIYSAVGSHGSRTSIPCPETRDELYAIASTVAGGKLRWHDGEWTYEGQQREMIHEYAPDADVIVVLDADEIWPKDLIWWYFEFLKNGGDFQRYVRIPMVHFWRSFNRAVIHDPAYPTRIINKARGQGEMTLPTRLKIAHMGYAQRSEIVNYKQLTHGHRGEWRKDDWFNSIFMANRQTDCHPVGSEYWNPEPVNPMDYMPAFMALHPFAKLEVIE